LLDVKTGVLLAPLLLTGACAITVLFLNPLFGASLALYAGLATAYTFYFKQALILDVIVLAALYALRVLSGGLPRVQHPDDRFLFCRKHHTVLLEVVCATDSDFPPRMVRIIRLT